MKGRYPIDRQFGIWAKFTPSLSRGFLRLAAFFLPLMPKGLSDRRVNVTRVTFEKGGKALLIAAADCAENAPCLVCFHGGGFVFGAARYHYENAKRYALMAGCKVLFVRYPLAPGNPWPAPNDACLAAYRHVLSHARELGIDAEKVAVGGDSAGGFLAADVALRAPEAGLPPPCFAMLIYPVIGGEETPSMHRFTDTPMWNARLNAKMWEYYAAGNQVILPGSRDLRAFPAAYVETAEFDCLHDEGARFAERLAAAGVSVQYNETKGTMHGFDAARKSAVAVKAVKERAAALRRAFEGQ